MKNPDVQLSGSLRVTELARVTYLGIISLITGDFAVNKLGFVASGV